MLEFVNSGLYFVRDENNFINPLLQVGSGCEKVPDPDTGTGGKKYRIRIRRVKSQRIRPNPDPHPCNKYFISKL